jgi:REG-2-like HAD superfamily hydrolase
VFFGAFVVVPFLASSGVCCLVAACARAGSLDGENAEAAEWDGYRPFRRSGSQFHLNPGFLQIGRSGIMHAMHPHFDAVTFDAGNTLVYLDFDRLAELLREFGVRIKPDRLLRAERETHAAFDRSDLIRSTTDAERWRAFIESTLVRAGVRAGPALGRIHEAVLEINRRNRLWSRVPRKVPRLLARLREAGYRMAVISNADGRIREFLEAAGLLPYFDAVLDSAAVGVEKPDPRIFHMALERLAAKPHRAVHVGDYVHIDVVGAERAGMTGVLLDPLGLRAGARVTTIRDIDELEPFLASGVAPSRKARPIASRADREDRGGEEEGEA